MPKMWQNARDVVKRHCEVIPLASVTPAGDIEFKMNLQAEPHPHPNSWHKKLSEHEMVILVHYIVAVCYVALGNQTSLRPFITCGVPCS